MSTHIHYYILKDLKIKTPLPSSEAAFANKCNLTFCLLEYSIKQIFLINYF
jgi:hypothetical protein